ALGPGLRAESVAVRMAFGIAMVEDVGDQDLRPRGHDRRTPPRLIDRLPRQEWRGRPQPHRLLEAGLEVGKRRDPRGSLTRRLRQLGLDLRLLLGVARDQ